MRIRDMTAVITRIPNYEHQARVLETRHALGFRTIEEWREIQRRALRRLAEAA